MSNLVDHARVELELVGEDPDIIAGYLNVIEAFDDMGHSGFSGPIAIRTISALLNWENLTPLTDDPDEWMHHDETIWGVEGGIWQNKRCPSAFSEDGGKRYYLSTEKPRKMHDSKKKA